MSLGLFLNFVSNFDISDLPLPPKHFSHRTLSFGQANRVSNWELHHFWEKFSWKMSLSDSYKKDSYKKISVYYIIILLYYILEYIIIWRQWLTLFRSWSLLLRRASKCSWMLLVLTWLFKKHVGLQNLVPSPNCLYLFRQSFFRHWLKGCHWY